MFTIEEYNKLHELVFQPSYAGWKQTVKEIPNGDGKVDDLKQYAHVAPKYFQTHEEKINLMPFLTKAFEESLTIAYLMSVAPKYFPRIEYGALRVLDYPPGAISNKHEDFDLYTLMLYRDQPAKFKAYDTETASEKLALARTANKQLHLGQLGEEIGLGKATLHEVLPSESRQHSIVYFAVPNHNELMPSGVTVKAWLNERMARSRTMFKDYE